MVKLVKALAMDLNVEVRDVQETHGKYSHQLEYAAAQLGAVLREAKEFPVEEEESGQEESEHRILRAKRTCPCPARASSIAGSK
ncbi:hypothetical protein PAXINDRAFT_12502 [Paxillus involutus ATCC 200175]|uniref:Uncharacterized protein n=1 Tax=Paxillus involutus ATCC 200175 TaxID=664439 RepID=A0A0C9SXZ9_PAXIN|nr:hypothetical protein PAXINDRAFT_12502 [Paxillus involutus ATCC 200175]